MPTEPSPGPGAPKEKKGKNKKATEKEKFIWAEEQQESGHNYKAVNPGSDALGIAQIMPANLPGWAHECGLPVKTPEEFLNDPSYQDQMVWCILGGYYDLYGPAGAAAMWYSGQSNPHETYGDPPVYVYVNDVLGIMRRAPNILPEGHSTSEVLPGGDVLTATGPVPKPGNESWAHSITLASNGLREGTTKYAGQVKSVQLLKIRRWEP
jgi:hypothetical protein